jgi:hypothetical protein
MDRSSAGRLLCTLVAMLALPACRIQGPPQPLPVIPVYEITPSEDRVRMSIAPAPSRDPLGDFDSTKRISLTTNNADARTLLLWLAQQAGVSLVVASDVSSRVSVTFNNVPAVEAMRAIIAEAGLSVLMSGAQAPWPPVVFHQMPVNINEASAETIAARFGVTDALAAWIVESRPRRLP